MAQRKGGVGKTTISVLLAAELRHRGAEVALIDADPLRSASQWAEVGTLQYPVYEIALSPERTIEKWVSDVKRIDCDVVVIDTPPSDEALGSSIALADIAIIPCLPSGLDLEATTRTMEIVNAVRLRRGGAPDVILVPNRVDRRTLEGRQLVDELSERFDELIAIPIGNRCAFVRAFSGGTSINDYEPDGSADRELRDLCDMVENCLRKTDPSGSRSSNKIKRYPAKSTS